MSFYREDNENYMWQDSLMERACEFVEERMASKEWPEREIGWFRVDNNRPNSENGGIAVLERKFAQAKDLRFT